MDAIYRRKRDLSIYGIVGVSPTTRAEFVRETFSLPVEPVSATINLIGVPGVISAKESPEVAKMYSECSFAAIDGMPIVKMARKKGFECERCAAPDIMGLIFEESVRRHKTHYFYGGNNDEVLKKLKASLEEKFPGIQIVGMYSPPFRPLTEEEDKAVCDEINSLKPDFLWVGIGAPKQEMWMWKHREKIHGTIMAGVGAGFNFYAGTLDKAPAWVEKAGLEWFFRFVKEPKRLWRRYILGGVKWISYGIGAKLKHKDK